MKKSLFSNKFGNKKGVDFDFPKENNGDCRNFQIENDERIMEKTPSPKKKGPKDYFNTMSIKKERKIFDRREDLEIKYENDPAIDARFMSTRKPEYRYNTQEKSKTSSSRLVNDYEILEVYFL